MEMSSHQKTRQKISRKGKSRLLAQPKKLQPSPFSISKNHPVFIETTSPNKPQNKFPLKRVSPFLLLGFFLMGLFPYMFITGEGAIHNTLLLLVAFLFLEINLVVFDFAIWNYFEGKRIFRIWLIEVPLTLLVIHLLI